MKTILKKKWLPVVSIIFFSLLSTLQSHSLEQLKTTNGSLIDTSTLSIDQLSVIKKIPTLGFRNTLSDWLFIHFLQYFGDDEARQKSGYDDSAAYLAATIHYDPYFKNFYIFLSGSSTIYAGKPEETVQVMSEGLEKITDHPAPDSYYIWRYKGTDELLFLNDGKAAQKSFEMAANWALQSTGEEAAMISQVSRQTAQFLTENPNSQLAQINAWGSILTTALDNQTRNRAIGKIRELGGDVMIAEDGQMQITYSRSDVSSDNRDI